MSDITERLAVLETEMSDVKKSIEHLDECMEAIKVTVWKASGAIALLLVILNLAWHYDR